MDKFHIERVTWSAHGAALRAVREVVFVIEQRVPLELELDGLDAGAIHLLANDAQGRPIGTARLLREGEQGEIARIGRMAVLAPWRGRGVGEALLRRAVEIAREIGCSQAYLHAQVSALNFYARHGFVAEGPVFDDAGIEHRAMRMGLT